MPTARVSDIDLFYQEDDFTDPWAPRDTVFMQHGFGRNSNFWRAWVPYLAREHRLIRMDLRGCGQSGDPGQDYKYSVEGFLGDFTGFLDALKIDQVHYVGESLGGIIGAAAAATHPRRFKSLTLVSTPMQVKQVTADLLAVGYPNWQDALRSLGMKEWFLRSREVLGERTGDRARDEYFATECARMPVHVAVAISRFAPTTSLAPLLPKIAVPTLMLTPGTSPHTSRAEQSEIGQNIPHVQQRVYEGANHGMFYLMPDPLARDTAEFLRGLKG